MKYPIKDPRTCYEWFSKIEKNPTWGKSIKTMGVDLY